MTQLSGLNDSAKLPSSGFDREAIRALIEFPIVGERNPFRDTAKARFKAPFSADFRYFSPGTSAKIAEIPGL